MTPIRINSKFQPLVNGSTRYYILTGGRGSSKSFSSSLWACTKTFDYNETILFTRYTLTSAKISIIPEFIEKLELLGVTEHFHITADSIVNKVTGSKIIFKGIRTSSGEQTANLKSLQGVTCWILDEAEELVDEGIFDKIDLSIRTKDAENKVVLILNPTTKEHFIYKRWFEAKVNDGFNGVIDDTTYIHTTYKDNIENLDESFLKQVERIKANQPQKYKHVILGGWMDKAEGVIYDNWRVGEFPEDQPYIFGLDFGFSPDPTALVKIARVGQKIYVKECCYKTGLTTDGIDRELSSWATKDDLIVGDHAEPRLIAELWDKGYNVVKCQKGKDSIKNGIAKIRDFELIVDGPNLVKELNNYVWNNRKASVPVDDYNHLLDAARYGITELLQGKEFVLY